MLLGEPVALIALSAFAGLLLSAAASDIGSFRIPNAHSLALAALFPAFALAAPGSAALLPGLGLAAAILLLGFVFYALRLCGAGDVKLLAGVMLWAGPQHGFEVAALIGLAGGVMAAALWLHHRWSQAGSLCLVLVTASAPGFSKRPMPYGAAIAFGGLYLAFTLSRGL